MKLCKRLHKNYLDEERSFLQGLAVGLKNCGL